MSSISSISYTGVIDIGSNSIRLVIYEHNGDSYRVITEHKDSARLSERIGPDGILHNKDILSVVPILSHYALLCRSYQVKELRAVATAAIRNARNSEEITRILEEHTGLRIEVLSGEEEARYGFLGVINTIDIEDGFIIDIGGGSTEVTLFRNRRMLFSHSFPFGSVNTTRQFANNGLILEQEIAQIRHMVRGALASQPWIKSAPGLPMVGLGGTIRTLGKMSQKRNKYSLQLAHNYVLKPGDIDSFLFLLSSLPLDKRKKIDGLSKERADIIVPGLTILSVIYEEAGAAQCIISGSGLRDGLFYEMLSPEQPAFDNVLEASLHNMLMLHPGGVVRHVRHVDRLALHLFDKLAPLHLFGKRCRAYLHAASLLYRIGSSINYYQFAKHTQYMITQARIDGFSHREIVLVSLIAAHTTKSRTHQSALAYKDILEPSDETLANQLGMIVQLAAALDRSETQPVQDILVATEGRTLVLKLLCTHSPALELREVAALAKDFEKVWGLSLKAQAGVFSTK